MKKITIIIYLLFFLVVSTTHVLFGQNNCPLNMRVEVTPGTCYDNGKVTIYLTDNSGNALDTANCDLTQIRYHYQALGTDSVYYADSNTLALGVGDYWVGVEAICYTGLADSLAYRKIDTTVKVSVTTTYVTPVFSVISAISNSSNIPTDFGCIPTLTCENTGRIQIQLLNGRFPYTVQMMDRTTGDTLRTVIFDTNMYNGTDYTKYDYKNYYSFDSLAAGEYLFHVSDACGYNLPDAWQAVTVVAPPNIEAVDWYYGNDVTHQDSNVVRFSFVTQAAGNENYAPMFSSMWQYRMIWPEINGITDTSEWHAAATGILGDTAYQAQSYCDLFGKPIAMEIRSQGCIDTAFTKQYTINKPNHYSFSQYGTIHTTSLVVDSISYDACGYTTARVQRYQYIDCMISYYSHYSTSCSSSYSNENCTTQDTSSAYNLYYTYPLKWIYINSETNDTIYQKQVSNINSNSYLYTDTVMKHYDTTFVDKPFTLQYTKVLIDAKGCELYRNNHTLLYKEDTVITGGQHVNSKWTTNYDYSTDVCCTNQRYMSAIKQYSNAQVSDSTIVRLESSPMNNKYNFTAIYRTATGWSVVKDSLSNLADIRCYPRSTNPNTSLYFYIYDYCLPSGPYHFIITDKCDTKTYTFHMSFPDTYSWEVDPPKYQTTYQCTEMNIKPTQGSYTLFQNNHDINTGEPTEIETDVPARFQIISGPVGGYNSTSIDTSGEFRVTMPGYYVIKMYNNYDISRYCEYPVFYDTVYFSGGTVEFEYCYAYVCDSAATTGMVRVKGKNGTEPYTYRLYSGPNKTGTELESNHTGIFSNEPLRLNQQISIEIIDNCNASFVFNSRVFDISTIKKAWFPGETQLTEICEGTQINIYGISLADDVSYKWDGPNGFHETTQHSSIFTPRNGNSEGWYVLEIISSGCTAPIKDSIYLSLKQAPSVEIAEDKTICPGDSVTLTYTPHGMGNISYTIGEIANSVVAYHDYTGTDGIAQTYPTAPLANTYFWVNSVSDNQCAYTIPEDSILIQLKSHISNGCDLITLHDTICYDSSAVVLAKSTLIDFPQTIRWYADNLQQTLVKQEELSTPDAWSQFNFNALTKDTTLYITVENSNYCEMQFGTIFNYVNMKAGTTTLSCGEAVRFYDEGGISANYENKSSIKHTFTSTDGLPINIAFSKFHTYDASDKLLIFSGTTTNSDSLLATLSGNLNSALPAPIESKSGNLTVWFLSNTQLNQSGWEAVVGCQNVAAQAMVSVKEPLHVLLTPNPIPPIHYNTTVDLRAVATGGRGEQYNYQWFTSKDSIHWISVANVNTADTNIYTTSELIVSTYVKVVLTDVSLDACSGSDTAVFMFNIADIALSLDLTTESYRVCGQPFNGNLRIKNQGSQTATGVMAVLKLPDNMRLLSPLSDTISVDTIIGNGGFVDIPLQLQVPLDTVNQYLMLKGQIWSADQGDSDLGVMYGDWDWNDNPRQVDEDTVSVYIPRYALKNESGLTANHVEVCYGDDALFMATASLNAPQYFKWYSDADLMHPLATDTVTKVGNDTLSEYLLHNVIQNTTYYVTVENESVCPVNTSEKTLNIQTGTTMITPGQRIHFYDSGGPDAYYSNAENYIYTFVSSDSPISITFNDFFSENCCDYLNIYDGDNTSAPMLVSFRGTLTNFPITYTSTGNKLTLYFHSDGSVIYRGWDATVFLLDQVVEGMVEATAKIKSAPATPVLTAISDSVCYDQTATLEASSALAFPQIYTWYNQDLSQVVFSDTVDGVAKTASQLTLSNQITDTTYFVTIQNAVVCPVRPSDKLVNVKPLVLMNRQNNNKTTVLSKDTNELLHFYDSGWLTSYQTNGTFTHTFVSQGNHIYFKFNNLNLYPTYQTISLYHGSTVHSDSLIVTLTGNQTPLCPLEYVSNGSQMTVAYTSIIISSNPGWDAEVTNYLPNDNIVLLNAEANKQTTHLFHNQIVRFFDDGGINNHHAYDLIDYSHTFSALQGTLSVKFNNIYVNSDSKLYVYDSDTIDPGKLLGEVSGRYTSYTDLPIYTSTGRNLTFRFVSVNTSYPGFDVDIISNFKVEEMAQADVMVYPIYDTIVYESTCQSTVLYQAAMGLKNLDVSNPGTFNYDSTFTTVHGCDSVVNLVLYVRPLPEITINSATSGSDTTNICVNTSVELTTSPDGAAYQWSYHSEITGFGSFIGYQVNNQSIQTTGFVPANEGWYKVEVSQEGCVATDSIYLQSQGNIGVPEVTNYFVSDTVVLADSVSEDINQVQYTPELTLKITDPIGGANNEGCPIQYRYYLAGSGSFTAWAEWPAGNDTITISNNLLNIGYSTFQFRHDPTCTQICGIPQVTEYKYFISLPDSATQFTADINESPICREQDSVRLTNIYALGFNSANSIYEYKYAYYHEGAAIPYYEGPETVADSAWGKLSTIGATLDDVIDPKYGTQSKIMIPNTPKISVIESPDGQTVLDQDIIRMSVRVKTIASINLPSDTVWTPLGKSTTEWVITSTPTFITPLADRIVNYFTTVASNPLNYMVTLSDSSYTDTIAWYWGDLIQTPNQELQYQTLPGSTTRFTYDSIAGMPQNGKHNTLSMYDFANRNDTLLLVAGMTSKLKSCPVIYDTARVIVVENAYITKIKGDSVQALCQYETMDSIVYKISGASHTAKIEWSPFAPNGIIFSSANDTATIRGTANEVGVFSYQVITIPSEPSAGSKMDTAIGSITIYPVYEETTLTRDPIIVCEPTYQIGDTIFTDNRISQVTLHSAHGCDSTIMVSVFINHINNPDYYFNLTCPDDIYDTLPNFDCSMPIYLGMPIVKHHVGDSLASYYDSIAVVHNAPVEFTAGTHTITWTATDSCGNTATCEQMVYIAYPPCPTAVDYDLNVYQAVRIDCDCWTQTNLKSQHYSDGSVIENVYSYQSELYPNVVDNVNKFGHLYTWYAAVDTATGMVDNGYGHIHGICPAGWYLPPIEKYESIARYGTSALKSPLYWLDGGGTNETGFSALPAGLYNGAINRYENLMGNAYFWSTTFVPGQNYAHAGVINYNCEDLLTPSSYKGMGYSIRCIKERE